MEKPAVFIGSSTEGLAIAEALFTCLSYDTKPKLWTHQLFLPGKYPMEALEEQLRKHNFAILVASPDDQVIKRGESSPSMRDNLLLEFGLFAGALGRKRAFFVCPSNPQIELPSDLFGLIVAKYDADRLSGGSDEIAAAVQVPCQQIRSVIIEEWAVIQDSNKKIVEKIRASEKGKAVERLHNFAIQLRDAVMTVQHDAFAAVNDEYTFNKVKKTAIEKVNQIEASFKEDATLIGIETELKTLSNVTTDAINDLPFPQELSLGKQATRQKVINKGFGALDTFFKGGDPFQHLEDSVTEESNMRINSLKQRYLKWWEYHYPKMDVATAKLQDKLFQILMALATSNYAV